MDVEAKRLLGKRTVKRGYVSVYSDSLGLAFTCKATDERSSRLECYALAHELLAEQRVKPQRRRGSRALATP